MVNPGPVPHVGGPASSGSGDVLIGFLPAARVGDSAVCVPGPDTIVAGAANVLVNNKPAARLGDSTAHGGVIVHSTCSIEREEDGDLARAVAAAHGLVVEREQLSLPDARVRDGGYFARLVCR